jgi:hypothetical protein
MAEKRADETPVAEGSGEAREGARKLHLSVTRMKKLRSNVKGGSTDSKETVLPWTQQMAQ